MVAEKLSDNFKQLDFTVVGVFGSVAIPLCFPIGFRTGMPESETLQQNSCRRLLSRLDPFFWSSRDVMGSDSQESSYEIYSKSKRNSKNAMCC